MNKLLLLILPLIFFSCATGKGLTDDYILESECPPQGECTLEILHNKGLAIKTDTATNRPYYEITDTPGMLVVKYTYSKKRNPDYQDDFYNEEVIFETDSSLTALKEGIRLKEAKALFGVMCFCRGKAGYYKPQSGTITLHGNLLTIQLPDDIIDGQLTQQVIAKFK
ncbi:hypothetical protein [Flavobacterium rhizosphaerae]|uniref:Lipoprotein n=1 Tax=Flavobacterium rhizosphaerae TaxID=3163298 RepID=A0ABW8YTE1_9FLAO